MADNVPVMIWMSGDDKFRDFFNKTWLEFTGRTLKEESNEGWLENVHPDDLQICIDNYNQSFNDQRGFYIEYRLKRHDGKYRWIADNSVPRYDADGSFAGFISACIDIDEQQKFREKIMESELLFKTISNASPAALWMTDKDEKNVFVSNTWLQWTGKTFEEQINRGWLSAVVEEDQEITISKFRECFAERKNFTAEFRFVRTDGQLRWGLTEGRPYYDLNEEFAGYSGSVTDITDIKRLEERKDDFIKMASHELKTPITSIKGYVQLLLNIYDELNEEKFQASRPTVKSSLYTISRQVTKLTRLVSELLDLSRIESGKLELRKTEFDLSDLVEEIVQDARHTTSRHAIIIHNDFEGSIYADKDRISQVLLNLLTNAIKYSPDADNVEVYVNRDKGDAVIKVKDHGIGIDKKEHPRIFERFYRVEGKSEQTYPGFGIGLFIANEIIQRHKGTISIKSEKGKGAEFTVTLPLNNRSN
jgi:PAS domain S-box-containing protein